MFTQGARETGWRSEINHVTHCPGSLLSAGRRHSKVSWRLTLWHRPYAICSLRGSYVFKGLRTPRRSEVENELTVCAGQSVLTAQGERGERERMTDVRPVVWASVLPLSSSGSLSFTPLACLFFFFFFNSPFAPSSIPLILC